jgi:hypothetical protein
MRTLLIVPLIISCAEPTLTEDTGDGLLRLASITGTVELGTTPTDDGRGSMLVILSIVSNETEIIPHRVFVEPFVNVGVGDFAMPFELTNIFPQDQPYFIGAFFDEDYSMASQSYIGANSGDLASWAEGELFQQVVLGSGEELELVIELITVVE